MEDTRVLVDTDIFIEFFRTRSREDATFVKIQSTCKLCYASAVTLFEFAYGSNLKKLDEEVWKYCFQGVVIIPVDEMIARTAAKIAAQLKIRNLDIGFRDSLVAATALNLDLPLASKNVKHFSRVKGLRFFKLSNRSS